METIIGKILNFTDLHNGEQDKKKVLKNIISNISFRGSNIWILAFAILIASVGLNVNSTAVIIGAMLISPLMGPIVGAGFSLGIYDFELLKKSVKNLLIATAVSLFVSTIYFYISPLKEVQSELLARTSPNTYDILIAFFGGLVGVIALTRVEKGNPIPGVAIATALMPPLCTAGYGLAIGNYSFFLGALYLYSINCVFICIATFLIVKFLKYPITKQANLKHQKRVQTGITILIVIMLVPSTYFAFQLFEKKRYEEKISTFIEAEFTKKEYPIIYQKIEYNSNPIKIHLAILTKKFTFKEIKSLNQKLISYDLPNTELQIKQDTFNLRNDILKEINNKTLEQKDIAIMQLQKKLATPSLDTLKIKQETKILFPQIKAIHITNYSYKGHSKQQKTIPIILYQSNKIVEKETYDKFNNWLKRRLDKDSIEIYRQEKQ